MSPRPGSLAGLQRGVPSALQEAPSSAAATRLAQWLMLRRDGDGVNVPPSTLSHCPRHRGASVPGVQASVGGGQAAHGDVTSEENIRPSAFSKDNVASPGCRDVAAERSLCEAATRSCLWASAKSSFPELTLITCRDLDVPTLLSRHRLHHPPRSPSPSQPPVLGLGEKVRGHAGVLRF